jgi:hypothetical protein
MEPGWWQATGWMAGVQFLAGARDFSHLHNVQTSYKANSASYPMETGGWFPNGKAIKVWSWPITSTYCKGQEWWNYTSTPSHIFKM